MPTTYFIGKQPAPEKKTLRKILIFLCCAALVITAGIWGYLHQYNSKLSQTISDFQAKLDHSEYQSALSMYREIQETVMKQSSDSQTNEKEILLEMEEIVREKTEGIITKIRSERYSPDAKDRAFLEQMGEVTGSIMSNWLLSLCEDFLFGQMERPTLQFVFDQIDGLSNVSAAAAPLQASMDRIELVSGEVQTAEKYMEEKSYIEAVKKYQSILQLETYSNNEYIRNFCQQRIINAKKMMYDPLLEQCHELMRYLRYYSAEKILSEMSQIFPNDSTVEELLLKATVNTSRVVPYTGAVEVLSVRPLLVDTELAFSDNTYGITEDAYLTTQEFSRVLESLYENDYILIDVRLLTNQSNLTQIVESPLHLPEGKKPVVIIAENINYSPRSMGLGFCRRLVLRDGEVCGEYITAAGETKVDKMAESIGILDAFVEANPNFSFDGAKGIISFSGFEVVMGYIIEEDQIDDYNFSAEEAGTLPLLPTQSELSKNRETVQEIMETMKNNGWVIASSTYSYLPANNRTMEEIQEDTEKWLSQVGSLSGETSILVYPFGSFINGSDPRCVYLKDNGFRIFFGISFSPYRTFGDNYLYLDRALLNGDSLRTKDFSRLFDAASVYDQGRRKPFFGD